MFTQLQVRVPKWIVGWIILGIDGLAGYTAFTLVVRSQLLENAFTSQEQIALFFVIQLFWSVVFWFNDLYRGEFTVSRISEIQTFIQVTFTIIVLLVFVDAIGLLNFPVNAPGIFRYWIIFSAIALSGRIVVRGYQKFLLRKGIGREKTLVLGYNARGKNAATLLKQHHQQGYDVVGFVKAVDDPDEDVDPVFPVLGEESQIKEIIHDHQVSDVVLALDKPEHTRIMAAVAQINGSPITIKIVPDMYEVISGLARTQQIAGLPLIEINPNLSTLYNRLVKRGLDLVIAIPLFILLLPVWGLIAILIKLDSPGPILYKQTRVGKDMVPFTIYKFRSMTKEAEKQTGPVWAHENDDRITKIGRRLRRFRLDEIPQLINVIKGEMSLIGPRPERPYFVERLMQEYPFYRRRLSVRPGITGWAQIKHPYDRDIEDVRQKLKYDFYYIENLSFNLDLKIVLSTVWVMISGQGR